MIRKIHLYGDPVLERESAPVSEEEFGSAELKQLVDDMFDTMYDAQGVGLAAPQVGVSKRVFIVDTNVGDEEGTRQAFINPEIVEQTGEQLGEEGCLSIPGFREKVMRANEVKARARDVAGNEVEVDADDLLARAILHEYDHLDGVLFLKHLSPLKRSLIQRKIAKLRKKGEWD